MARVLVIDDAPIMRKTLRSVLESSGHRVVEAADGVEGSVRQAEYPFDLVITDIVMPNKGGIHTIQDLRRDYPDLKIIAISADGYERGARTLSRAQALGADQVLAKPFTALDILSVVDSCLHEKAA